MRKILLLSLVIISLVLIPTLATPSAESPEIEEKVIDALAENETVDVIITLKDKPIRKYGLIKIAEASEPIAREKAQNQVLDELDTDELKVEHRYTVINGFSGELTKEGLNELANNPDVERIEYDRQVRIALDTSVAQIEANVVWNQQISGTNVTGADETVCIVDTGVDYNHTNLGADCFGNNNCTVIGGYDYVSDDAYPDDDNGHGTHIAGNIASNHSTYKGVAPDTKIIAIKVLNSAGSGSTSDVVAGINWCKNNASTYNISVISLSLTLVDGNLDEIIYTSACDGEDSVVNAANSAGAAGVFVVAAAGNDGNVTGIGSPACGSNVTAVGGVTGADATIYNRGSILDLVAPGSSITSTKWNTDTFYAQSGTSMATPHVAAAAALLYQTCDLNSVSCTRTQIYNALNDTGVTVNDTGASKSNSTYARINVSAAYNSLLPPDITFEFPTNGSRYNYDIIWANVTMDRVTSEANASINASTNISMTNDTLYHYYLNSSNINVSNEGDHNISYWANGTNDNSLETVYFTIDKTAPASVSGLANQTVGVNWIYWNWTEPNVADFNHTEAWRNNTFIQNISNGTNYYNATCLAGGATYLLSARTTDTASNTNTSWQNDTATTSSDSSGPTLAVSIPGAGTSYSTVAITYTASLTDHASISWCGASTDSGANQTMTLASNTCNTTSSMYAVTATLSSGNIGDGSHDVNIYCNDTTGNTHSTVSRSFTINTQTSGGGGGGGGGGSTSNTITYGQQISLSSSSEASFSVRGSSHTLKISNVNDAEQSATITVSSTPTTFTLNVGDSRDVDIDGDAIEDINVILNKIYNSKAYVTVTQIPFVSIPEIEKPEENKTVNNKIEKETNASLYVALAILAVILVVAAVLTVTLLSLKKSKQDNKQTD